MALFKCPECGNEISTTAKSCPRCGYQIRPDEPQKSKENTSTGTALLYLVIAILCLILTYYSSSNFTHMLLH